jgi:hypothetical protein
VAPANPCSSKIQARSCAKARQPKWATAHYCYANASGTGSTECYSHCKAAYFLGRSKEENLNSAHNKVGKSSDSADGRYYKHQRNSHPKARLAHNASIAFCIGAWALGSYLQNHTRINVWIALGMGFFGFVPYLLSVYFVEPWISRRYTDRSDGK